MLPIAVRTQAVMVACLIGDDMIDMKLFGSGREIWKVFVVSLGGRPDRLLGHARFSMTSSRSLAREATADWLQSGVQRAHVG